MANKKIRIRLKAYEHRTLDTAAAKIVESATRTGAQVAGPIPLPTERSLYTIIRATHKYKDSREQLCRDYVQLEVELAQQLSHLCELQFLRFFQPLYQAYGVRKLSNGYEFFCLPFFLLFRLFKIIG